MGESAFTRAPDAFPLPGGEGRGEGERLPLRQGGMTRLRSELNSASKSRNVSIHFCRFRQQDGRFELALRHSQHHQRPDDGRHESRARRN